MLQVDQKIIEWKKEATNHQAHFNLWTAERLYVKLHYRFDIANRILFTGCYQRNAHIILAFFLLLLFHFVLFVVDVVICFQSVHFIAIENTEKEQRWYKMRTNSNKKKDETGREAHTIEKTKLKINILLDFSVIYFTACRDLYSLWK